MSVPPRSKKTAFSRAMETTSGALAPRRRVPPLVGGQGVDRDRQRLELQAGDAVVDLLGDGDDPLPEGLRPAGEELRRKGLNREAHVHDLRGMALARGKVHEAPLREGGHLLP